MMKMMKTIGGHQSISKNNKGTGYEQNDDHDDNDDDGEDDHGECDGGTDGEDDMCPTEQFEVCSENTCRIPGCCIHVRTYNTRMFIYFTYR